MLEHAHGHDAVEGSAHLAIVLQAEIGDGARPFLRRPPARYCQLSLRQGDAGDARAGDLRQIEREPAPAAADIEHPLPGPDQQLGGDVAALGELRIVERLVGRLEIGAAVLPVGIEKQRIEPVVEIVVMRDIVPGAAAPVELAQAAAQIAQQLERPGPRRRRDGGALQHREHVGDRALLDDQRAVHVGLAEPELGIEHDAAFRGGRGETKRDRLAGAVAKGVSRAACGPDPKISRTDEFVQRQAHQPVHCASHRAATAVPPRPRHIWRPPASLRTAPSVRYPTRAVLFLYNRSSGRMPEGQSWLPMWEMKSKVPQQPGLEDAFFGPRSGPEFNAGCGREAGPGSG